jgi:hypothetical protein
VNKLKGREPIEAEAQMMVDGIVTNAITARRYSKMLPQLHLTECLRSLTETADRAADGDLSALERMLAAQAVTLNTMFTQMANQASLMTLVNQTDLFTRLALKAQGQCRTTVETLALIKGGVRTVFARQANIASGPQQVNNVAGDARAENPESAPIELLEAPRHVERVDVGTTAAAGRGDPALETVAAVNRSPDGFR